MDNELLINKLAERVAELEVALTTKIHELNNLSIILNNVLAVPAQPKRDLSDIIEDVKNGAPFDPNRILPKGSVGNLQR